MIQEHKELLLKDLCSRLPYGVKVQFKINEFIENKENFIYNEDAEYKYITNGKSDLTLDIIKMLSDNYLDWIKPYLFPLSSMTEEQKEEFIFLHSDKQKEAGHSNLEIIIEPCKLKIDWLYKNHFDVNNLIPIGLANDSTGLNIY